MTRMFPTPHRNIWTEARGQLNMHVYLSMWGPSEFTVTGPLKGAET